MDDSDTIINQYIQFCIILAKQVNEHGRTITAIRNAIKFCKDKNFLKEYLKAKETEIEGIMLTLFDQDRVTEIYGAEMKAEGILSTLASLVKDGIINAAEAAKRAGVSEDEMHKAVAML